MEKIPLSDYERHMSMESVFQLQALNRMMKEQIADYAVSSLAILGIAGGNGLEHTINSGITKIYGIDVNRSYLDAVKTRYGCLGERLECLCLDLTEDACALPEATYVIANLFLEYVGYDPFIRALCRMHADYVSCIIQVNAAGNWVSDSPYERCFEVLNQIHHDITENTLKSKMQTNGYTYIKRECVPLPNGKQLVRVDFKKANHLQI